MRSGLAFRQTVVYGCGMEANHDSLIAAIGPKAVREAYDLSRQTLHNWRKRGIPCKYRVAVARLAAERGVPVPQDFFEDMAA